jgi:hypothetical protein|tara:strand:+ start:948 stop:1235 length:288 start_codon:yes stop_codon:yes gene_type:complete
VRSAFDNEIEVASGSDAEEDALCLSFDFSLTLCFNVVERMAVATRSFFVSCFSVVRGGYANKSGDPEQITEKSVGMSKFELRPMRTVGVKAREKK